MLSKRKGQIGSDDGETRKWRTGKWRTSEWEQGRWHRGVGVGNGELRGVDQGLETGDRRAAKGKRRRVAEGEAS